MNIPLFYEKMYIRKKIHEYSLPTWLEHFLYTAIFLKFIFFYPTLGIIFYFILNQNLISANMFFLISIIYSVFEARSFPFKNYLAYSVKRSVIVNEPSLYQKVYLITYTYFLCINIYKYFVLFLMPLYALNTGMSLVLILFLIAFFLISGFMNIASYTFLKNYEKNASERNNFSILKLICICGIVYCATTVFLSFFDFNLNIENINLNEINYENNLTLFLIIMIVFFFISWLFHLKVIKGIGEFSHIKSDSFVQSKLKFTNRPFFRKDFLIIRRTYYNKLKLLKLILIVHVLALSLLPTIIISIFQYGNSYAILSVLFLALIFSNFKVEYLKKVVSPDIEFTSLPRDVVYKISLNHLFLQKLYLYFIISIIPAFFSLITLIIHGIDILDVLASTVLIILMYTNMGIATTVGAVLYPKLNPESDYEIGNSKKSVLFANSYMYLISILLSLYLVVEFLNIGLNMEINIAPIQFLGIIIGVQILILLIIAFYLRNIDLKEVIRNAN